MLTWGLAHVYRIPNAWVYGLLLFTLTHFIYNFQRLAKGIVLGHASPQINWLKHYIIPVKLVTGISLVGAFVLFLIVFSWNIYVLLVGTLFLALSLFYVIPLRGKNLRDRPYIKIHLIALVWTFACGLFPLLNAEEWSLGFWFLGLNQYLYILAITIPFDIRDMHTDAPVQRSLPQVLGSRNARLLALILILVFMVNTLLLVPSLRSSFFFYLIMLYHVILILRSESHRPFWFFGGLLDGGIILLGISYLLVR